MWLIVVEIAGRVVRAFTWSGNMHEGIDRAKTEYKNVSAKIWADPV
jgi:hypothetical protein